MKITKRRSGYTIRCNESEFKMLRQLVEITPHVERRKVLRGPIKNAYSRRLKGRDDGDLFRIDSDVSDRVLTGNALNIAKQ